MRFICRFLLILISVFYVSGDNRHGDAPSSEKKATTKKKTGEMTFLDWNILAPIWIERKSMKESGLWDMTLLEDETRLNTIIKHILDYDADIVTLQEVQKNFYSEISGRINETYTPVAFSPNINDYWKEYLPKGVKHVKNGVATFYKTERFMKVAHETFPVGKKGNIALATVVRPKLETFQSDLSGRGNPFIVINIHLESGFKPVESMDRVAQGNIVMKKAKNMSTEMSKKFPKNKPVVIIAGDFNSFDPFPGFINFEDNGYLDTMKVTGDLANTFYYSQSITLPSGYEFEGAAIDHVLVRKSDVEDGRIEVESVKTPDLTSQKLKKEKKKPRHEEKEKESSGFFSYLWNSKIISTIVGWFQEEPNLDTNINRALRFGSDHLSLLVNFKIGL